MIYMFAIVLIALGFIDYPILAYHIGTKSTIDVIYIPLLYALAMGVDAIAALIFGHLYDKKGIISLVISVMISGMGAQESILKAVISVMVSKEKRATAYGIFYTVFGSAWFLGSVIIGFLYDLNLVYVVIFSTLMELLAVIFLLVYQKKIMILKVKEV